MSSMVEWIRQTYPVTYLPRHRRRERGWSIYCSKRTATRDIARLPHANLSSNGRQPTDWLDVAWYCHPRQSRIDRRCSDGSADHSWPELSSERRILADSPRRCWSICWHRCCCWNNRFHGSIICWPKSSLFKIGSMISRTLSVIPIGSNCSLLFVADMKDENRWIWILTSCWTDDDI